MARRTGVMGLHKQHSSSGRWQKKKGEKKKRNDTFLFLVFFSEKESFFSFFFFKGFADKISSETGISLGRLAREKHKKTESSEPQSN